jgi:predicted metalloprotease
MRLDDERESDNIEDRRTDSGGFSMGAGHIGIGGILLALAVSYFTGVNPMSLLGLMQNPPPVTTAPAHPPPAEDPGARFVSKVLASTEDTWRQIFQENGKTYQDPKLVLFTGSTPTACGAGKSAIGPFYCPIDGKVYIDLGFFQQLRDRFHAPGEFAEAYVVAHEVGHHVQNLLGTSRRIETARLGAISEGAANALSVRLELQADCYAGVWGKRADSTKHILDPGEVEEAITAASAIGDDRLQEQTRGYVAPDSFTHGSSEQRVRWFKRGFASGDPRQCNTFKVDSL